MELITQKGALSPCSCLCCFDSYFGRVRMLYKTMLADIHGMPRGITSACHLIVCKHTAIKESCAMDLLDRSQSSAGLACPQGQLTWSLRQQIGEEAPISVHDFILRWEGGMGTF